MLIFDRKEILAKILWLPMMIGILVSILQQYLPSWNANQYGALAGLSVLVLTIMLAVRTYKVLLGSDLENYLAPISWSICETRFLLLMFLISSVFILMSFLIGSVLGLFFSKEQPIGWAGMIFFFLVPVAYLASRFLLAFPAVAIKNIGIADAIRHAWLISNGHSIPILFLCILMPAGLAWGLAFLSSIPGAGIPVAVMTWLLMPLELSIVAMVYSILSKKSETSLD